MCNFEILNKSVENGSKTKLCPSSEEPEASSGQTMSRLAPAKKPKGARRNTLSPKSARRRTMSPQRPGHAQTIGLPKPAGRKDQGNPASKVSRPASAKHDGLAHKSIAQALTEKKTKSPPGKKGGRPTPSPEARRVADPYISRGPDLGCS